MRYAGAVLFPFENYLFSVNGNLFFVPPAHFKSILNWFESDTYARDVSLFVFNSLPLHRTPPPPSQLHQRYCYTEWIRAIDDRWYSRPIVTLSGERDTRASVTYHISANAVLYKNVYCFYCAL